MKNFYINNKNLTCFFLLMLWCLCLSSLGCSSIPSEKVPLVTYQTIGETLQEAKISLRLLCIDGTLDDTECTKGIIAYNKAVTAYKAMGDAYTEYVDSGDDTQYRNLALTLSKLLIVLNQFLLTQ